MGLIRTLWRLHRESYSYRDMERSLPEQGRGADRAVPVSEDTYAGGARFDPVAGRDVLDGASRLPVWVRPLDRPPLLEVRHDDRLLGHTTVTERTWRRLDRRARDRVYAVGMLMRLTEDDEGEPAEPYVVLSLHVPFATEADGESED